MFHAQELPFALECLELSAVGNNVKAVGCFIQPCISIRARKCLGNMALDGSGTSSVGQTCRSPNFIFALSGLYAKHYAHTVVVCCGLIKVNLKGSSIQSLAKSSEGYLYKRELDQGFIVVCAYRFEPSVCTCAVGHVLVQDLDNRKTLLQTQMLDVLASLSLKLAKLMRASATSSVFISHVLRLMHQFIAYPWGTQYHGSRYWVLCTLWQHLS